jgi:cell wall-associated NlpC family hydrolase
MSDIVSYARECIGTPFRHQGRTCGLALDCAGVIIHCAKRAGVEHADMQGYARVPFKNRLQEFLNSQPNLREVSVADMSAGDVILMRITAAPQHLGIYAGNDYMIHSYEAIGKVAEQRIDADWLKKIVAVYRFAQ